MVLINTDDRFLLFKNIVVLKIKSSFDVPYLPKCKSVCFVSAVIAIVQQLLINIKA